MASSYTSSLLSFIFIPLHQLTVYLREPSKGRPQQGELIKKKKEKEKESISPQLLCHLELFHCCLYRIFLDNRPANSTEYCVCLGTTFTFRTLYAGLPLLTSRYCVSMLSGHILYSSLNSKLQRICCMQLDISTPEVLYFL